MNNNDATTRGIKNCRDSRLFKGCSPLQLLCNLTGNRPQSATFHTANVRKHKDEQDDNVNLHYYFIMLSIRLI